MLPTFIYHKKHVINLYISDEVLSTWGFQMWHIINLYISKTLIYTFKRSNNISEGTYQLQGSKCDTLSIHTSMLSMCKPLINLCILEATCHAFIYLFIYLWICDSASITNSSSTCCSTIHCFHFYMKPVWLQPSWLYSST